MIQILLIIAGIYILIKGKINFSKRKELVRPRSTYIGIAFIIIAISVSFINYGALALLLITIIASYFLSQNTTK